MKDIVGFSRAVVAVGKEVRGKGMDNLLSEIKSRASGGCRGFHCPLVRHCGGGYERDKDGGGDGARCKMREHTTG